MDLSDLEGAKRVFPSKDNGGCQIESLLERMSVQLGPPLAGGQDVDLGVADGLI